MQNKLKIAISGRARCGKNTVANMIIHHLNLSPQEYRMRAFADPMKEIARLMFPVADPDALYGASERRSEIISPDYTDNDGNLLTYRQFLCDLGKFGRKYNPKIWVKCLDHDYKQNSKLIYTVPDLRFIEEYEYLKENKFILIRVKRKNIEKIDDVSETGQDALPDSLFDYIINNDSTIDFLNTRVLDIVEEWA
jgi:hypothetical protein